MVRLKRFKTDDEARQNSVRVICFFTLETILGIQFTYPLLEGRDYTQFFFLVQYYFLLFF